MSVGAILTLGLGTPFGDVTLLPTLGYLSGTSGPTIAATGGWLGRSYEEWERRQPAERPAVTVEQPSSDRLSEYEEKSRKIMQAIARLRDETATIEEESEAIREALTGLQAKKKAKERAAQERALMLKEQALTLARAQEAALLEQLEAVDVAYVAVIALTAIIQ